MLEFSYLGFIGKLFKSTDLPLVVEFFLMFYKDKPIDWLLDHLLSVKVCNPEKDAVSSYLIIITSLFLQNRSLKNYFFNRNTVEKTLNKFEEDINRHYFSTLEHIHL